ncbi:putative manganese-dependent inorganic diphosphatase [Irregularibacter muris]|uniref:inorganic diphosphatase n=1 Tax=Irregularibacter muris TaxID=1796619 RepID=A0AAE3HCK5_9FIRM|nr:putative manganese-dependent inorganic diphosphatase [Irregularibacter muris]MCR1897655.1 putative manganese-dependent inorganic diphosphatase [Irregularibacter muris]
MKTLIFGHRNPDTDSIASAIALSHLKNKLGNNTLPCRLGAVNKETKYVLDYFQMESPHLIGNVKTQVRDLNYDKIPGLLPHYSILHAYKLMEKNNIRTLPIVDHNNQLMGIITMKDIAMALITGDLYKLETSMDNILQDLEGEALVVEKEKFQGKISVIALYSRTLKKLDFLNEESIVIVGDRFSIIDHAIKCKVQLIIISGKEEIPQEYIEKAKEKGVSLIRVPKDTYTISKLINQCNFVSSIMISENIMKFDENEYLDEVKEEIVNKNHANYPIVDSENKYLGIMNKQHLLIPDKKQVILVDHNEYAQSAQGIREAEIMEIIDHHKLGDISTTLPIHFRNLPVGSTCTIVYNMYREYGVEISAKMAGLLMAGILSDTLSLKSPTTTEIDHHAIRELNKILHLDIEDFSMSMFKAGTSLEGQSVQDIFFKDYKVFNVGQDKIGVSQVFTLDIEEVFSRKEVFLEFIRNVHQEKNHFLTLLIITDILKGGSYVLYECGIRKFISTAFNVEAYQGVFVKDIVSRKKQVVPRIMQAINMLK